MEIRLLLDEKVLWAQSVAEMETNMALNYSVLLRSPSPDATVQVTFTQVPKPGWEESEPALIGSCSWKLAETGSLIKDVSLPNSKKKVGAVLRMRSIALGGGSTIASGLHERRSLHSEGRSWQVLGSSEAFQNLDGVTNFTKDQVSLMPAADETATLVPGAQRPQSPERHPAHTTGGPRSTGPGSGGPGSKGPGAAYSKMEVDDVSFYDSVSQVGARGPLGVKPRSNMTSASSVPQAYAGGAAMNASALCARFMVDIRIFEWTPQSVEEYLNSGQVPNGLPLDGQASVSALALGFDYSTNQYDNKSQIYNSAIWTKDQQLLATAVQEGLDYVLSQAAQLDELVRLGLRISRQWVYHILKGEMVWGPALAMWVSQRRPLKFKTRVQRGGFEIQELLPADDGDVDYYAHGNWYLSFLKDSLLQGRVWQGGPRSSVPRCLPANQTQERHAMDQEIENYNKGLLQTAFERVSLVPQTAGCFLRLRENTRPMYTLPQIIGQIYMQVCTDPHKFLSASALGLIGPPGTNAQTWWVAMDGWYYVLMSQVIGDGLSATADSIRWYKCGLNAASHDPTNLNEAVPDEGGRTLAISYHQYDGMTPRSSVMTVGTHGEVQTTMVLWFQKPPTQQGRRQQDRHLIRCVEVPTEIKEAMLARPNATAAASSRAPSAGAASRGRSQTPRRQSDQQWNQWS
ncbi:unnamed protein product [Cladocopium goreaui]|uniref:Uncharacterized protein n=1 Tax=Cladocopium goreaui TaxID=2562237 RepID=A0A9P1GFK6_9DINO|nr:unnamed protein product [Cladocopium goreaui]